MDFYGSVIKLFSIYQKLKQMNIPRGVLGLFSYTYELNDGSQGFILSFCTESSKKDKLKKKSAKYQTIYDKIIMRSKKDNKAIVPKYFPAILNYMSAIFDQIATGRQSVLSELEMILISLRLRIFIRDNMKYKFGDPKNPQILIQEVEGKDGEYSCHIHIFQITENGLILKYERQIEYIQEQLRKGVNPAKLNKLPKLRTGDTYLDDIKEEEEEGKKKKTSTNIENFRKKINKRIYKDIIQEELGFDTVVDNFNATENSKEEQKPKSANEISPNKGLFSTPEQKSKHNTQQKPSPSERTQQKPSTSRDTSPPRTREKLNKEERAEIDKIIQQAKEKINQLQEENRKLMSKYKGSESLNSMLQNKIKQLEEQNKYYMDKLQEMVDFSEKIKQNEHNADAITQYQKANSMLSENIVKISEENEDLRTKIQYIQNENFQIKNQMESVKNASIKEMKKLDDIIKILAEKNARYVMELEDLKEDIEQYELTKGPIGSEGLGGANSQQMEEYIIENELLSKAIKVKDKQFSKLAVEFQQVLDEKEDDVQEKSHLRSKIIRLKSEINKLEKPPQNNN